jgi:arylformamidase
MTTPVYRGYDQAALDAQYNLRALVPEHPEHFRRWAEAGAEARARLDGHLDQPYGDDPKQRLDYFPAAENGAPLLAFIHGGYWQALDKSDFSWLAPAWVERGVSFASINYPLAPEAGIPEMVESCREAALWLWHNAISLGADRGRLVLAGHSAGGHLATMLLASDWTALGALPADLVKAACSVSGLYDLEPIRLSYQNPILKLDEATARSMSPIAARPRPERPLLLAVGERETPEFLRQQDEMAAHWGKGGKTEAILLPGLDHFQAVDCLSDPSSPALAWLERRLGIAASPM